jgi:hypothetical protein
MSYLMHLLVMIREAVIANDELLYRVHASGCPPQVNVTLTSGILRCKARIFLQRSFPTCNKLCVQHSIEATESCCAIRRDIIDQENVCQNTNVAPCHHLTVAPDRD